MGLPYGENFIILTSTVFLWSTRLTGIVLFSVPRDGNLGLENAIFRPWMTENSIEYAKCPSPGAENSERNSLFSVPSQTENSVFQTLISVPRDGK